MKDKDEHINELLDQIEELKSSLFESNSIIDAIKEGSVDALVLHNEGVPQIYSIESADYTYRILIEKFSEGALSITHEGLILYCNDYFAKLINIPAGKITGTNLQDYFAEPEEFPSFMDMLANGNSKGEIILDINGRKVPIYISFTSLLPNVHAVGVVVTDLTDKKAHEQALINYQRDLEQKISELHTTNTNLSQFIHVISHDLKEPLRKMLMYTSRLKPEVYATEAHNPLQVIKLSAMRLNSLVDDLVKYSFTVIKQEEVKINLNEILSEVVEDLEIIMSEKNAFVEVDSLPVIAGSKVQMRQLFSNLIVNAIKYSREGVLPHISINCEVVEETLGGKIARCYKINVQDNGIGMEASHLDKIFTIFQRLHHRHEYSGNGIGLAICKKIMENHKGRISVESLSGQGSTFSLYFPVLVK